MKVTLSGCRYLYETHFKKEMPGNLPFETAAKMVRDDVGWKEFERMISSLSDYYGLVDKEW